MRVESGRPALVTAVFHDLAGQPADQAGGVTVTVSDGAGVTTATGTAARTAVGTYQWTLAAVARPDRVVVTFTGSYAIVRPVLVVDRRLCTVKQVRDAIGSRQVQLVGGAVTDDAVLDAAIEAAEDWIDEALHYPATVQGWRRRWSFQGGRILHVPSVITPGRLWELARDGTVVDVSAVEVDRTGWWARAGWPAGRYVGWGSHGLADPPGQLVRACAVLAAYLARSSNVPERATVIRTEGSEIVLRRPGADSPTGLTEVDSVISSLARPQPLG